MVFHKILKANLSTAYSTTSRYSSGRKIGPLCRTVGRIYSKHMGPLFRLRRFQDPIQFTSSSIYSSDKSESIFFPIVTRRNKKGSSPVTGSGKNNKSRKSRFLLLPISFTQKQNGKLHHIIDLSIFYLHKKTTIQDEDNQISTSVDICQPLGCLCIFKVIQN